MYGYEKVAEWIDPYKKEIYSDGYDSAEGKYYDDLLNVPMGKNYMALKSDDGSCNPKYKPGSRYWSFLLKLHPDRPSSTIISSRRPLHH